jgi:hypothetical protein
MDGRDEGEERPGRAGRAGDDSRRCRRTLI